uniref:SFRICE_037492 n=1 Tax=Spodoptera frugiperda TaxID=7108 RepID=A0A2H1WYL8_SPOFR
MYTKVVALFGLVAVATAADLSVGREGGRLIFDKNVTASPAIWKQVQNLTVNATDDGLISRVVVIDNRPEKDGEAKVVDGGVGHNDVTIELKSPTVFRGFDFTVKVYASEGAAQFPQHPVPVGADTKVPVTKDVNKPQEPKNDGDLMIGGPVSTPSTTEAHKDGQAKVTPAVEGQEQPRPSRDTQEQQPKDVKGQTTIPTPTEPAVVAAEDVQDKEHHDQTVMKDMDPSLKQALDAIFNNNASQKSDDTQKVEVLPIKPENDKDGQVPRVLKVDEVTTPKAEASSTTLKNEEQKPTEASSTTLKNEEPVSSTESASSEVPTTKLTTESSKLPQDVQATQQLEQNIKGHPAHAHHAVPLPFHNYSSHDLSTVVFKCMVGAVVRQQAAVECVAGSILARNNTLYDSQIIVVVLAVTCKKGTFERQSKYNNINNVSLSVSPLVKLFRHQQFILR